MRRVTMSAEQVQAGDEVLMSLGTDNGAQWYEVTELHHHDTIGLTDEVIAWAVYRVEGGARSTVLVAAHAVLDANLKDRSQ